MLMQSDIREMDLSKCVIEGKYKSVFYCRNGQTINEENSVLLGFKDNVPVLGNSMAECSSSPDLTVKKTLKVEVNSQTGEKFINLNGRKLKMVTESELPPQLRQNKHLLKVASMNGVVARSPVTLKIVGNVSSLLRPANLINNQESLEIDKNNFKPNVNKADISLSDNNELSCKTMLIKEYEPHTAINTSIGKVVPVRASALAGSVNEIQNKDIKLTKAKLKLTKCEGTETKVYNSVLTMKTSDLPKLSKHKKTVAVRRVVHLKMDDKSIQIDRNHFQTDKCVQTDKYVQTEETYPPLIENQDFCNIPDFTSLLDYINCDPFTTPIPNKSMNSPSLSLGSPILPVSLSTVQNEKVRMFFTDLNRALKPDAKGNMPIHVGVLSNDVNSVKRSCNVLRALQKSVDMPNHSDLTALQLAVFNNSDPEIVKILLRHNAKLDVTDTEGNNVIHLAVEFERKEILDLVLRAADVSHFSLDHFNAEGITALMICCINGFLECADLLLKFDADVNVRDGKSGRTALFHAAENHDYDMVQLLLSNGADTKIKNFFGTSPHDAMYEVEEIPEQIKMAILGRSAKRKITEEPKVIKLSRLRKTEDKKKLKTYARFQKIDDFNFMTNATSGQVK